MTQSAPVGDAPTHVLGARLRVGPRAGVRAGLTAPVAAVAAVVLVGAVVPVLVAQRAGAFGIVRNDDWSYLLTLFHWVDGGRLDFNNWVSMTLLAQLVLAAPIVQLRGHDIGAIQLLTTALGLCGLLSVLWLGVATRLRIAAAAFVALLVAAGPLWGPLAVSFMTDVPAFAFSAVACALGVRALARSRVSLPYLAASMLAGLVGFTIRQYAAVPVVAVALVAGWSLAHEHAPRRWRTYVAVCAGVLAAAGLFLAYWSTIPHPRAFTPGFPTSHSVRSMIFKGTGLARLLGLLVAPAVVAAGPVRIVRRAWATAVDTTLIAGIGTLAVLGFTGWAGPNIGFAGNYIAPDGVLSQGVSLGTRPEIFPPGVWEALLVAGTVGAALLALAAVPLLHQTAERVAARDLAPRDPAVAFLGLVAFGYGLAYALAAMSGLPLFDRYVLPVVPIVAILVLRVPSLPTPGPSGARAGAGRRAGALAALAVLGAIGLVYTVDAASFDGARWKVAVAATQQGWSRQQIRGGFEWVNFYAFDARVQQRRHTLYCVSVVLDPQRGVHAPEVIASGTYRSPLTDPVPVAAIRTKKPCVPARASAP